MYGVLLNSCGLSAAHPAEHKKDYMGIVLCAKSFHWLLLQKHIGHGVFVLLRDCYVSICAAVEMDAGADYTFSAFKCRALNPCYSFF